MGDDKIKDWNDWNHEDSKDPLWGEWAEAQKEIFENREKNMKETETSKWRKRAIDARKDWAKVLEEKAALEAQNKILQETIEDLTMDLEAVTRLCHSLEDPWCNPRLPGLPIMQKSNRETIGEGMASVGLDEEPNTIFQGLACVTPTPEQIRQDLIKAMTVPETLSGIHFRCRACGSTYYTNTSARCPYCGDKGVPSGR